jgi:hypothetical protein
MVSIKKRDGSMQSFDRSKVERSLRESGASERVAREVASSVREREGMTCDDIRSAVSRELRSRDAKAADHYDSTRRMVARRAVEAASRGTAWISSDAMRTMRLKAGEPVDVSFSGKTQTLRAETAPRGVSGVQVSEPDLKALGAREGMKVEVRRRA